MNKRNKICVTNYFKIEDSGHIERWLSDILSDNIKLPRVNSSEVHLDMNVSEIVLPRIRKCFPLERQIYSF